MDIDCQLLNIHPDIIFAPRCITELPWCELTPPEKKESNFTG